MSFMKKALLVVMVMAVLFCLVGCGGGKNDDPNVGMWKATSISMLGMDLGVDDVFNSDVTIELKSNGRFEMIVDGETGAGTWDVSDGTLNLSSSDANISGKITGTTLVIENIEDTGVDVTFEKQ